MTKSSLLSAIRTDSAVDVTEFDDDTLWRYCYDAIQEHDPNMAVNEDATGLDLVSSVHKRAIVLLTQITICLNRAAKAASKASMDHLEGSFDYSSVVTGNLSLVTTLRDQYDEYCSSHDFGKNQVVVSDFSRKGYFDGVASDFPVAGSLPEPALTLDSFSGNTAVVTWTPFTKTRFWKYVLLYNTSNEFYDKTAHKIELMNVSDDATVVATYFDVRTTGAEVEDVEDGSFMCLVVYDLSGRMAFSNTITITS